jgi:hypothetical protein
MIQSFQCPVCSTLNAIGEPECTDCGQGFVYNCPVCGSPLNNRYTNCPGCHTLFNWAVAPPQSPPDAVDKQPQANEVQQETQPAPKTFRQLREKGAGITSRPMFWAMLVVICAVLIALLLIVDGLIHA